MIYKRLIKYKLGMLASRSCDKRKMRKNRTKAKSRLDPFFLVFRIWLKKSDIYDDLAEVQKDFLDMLEPLNIEARYPTHKEQLLKSLTEERCSDIIKNAQELKEWINRKL
jgi:hypothetical protein